MLSPLASEHVNRPRNCGPLEGATHYGQVGVPGEGPYVQMWLQVEHDTILSAAYRCNGCPSTIASSSLVAEIMTGRTVEQALKLTAEDVVTILGGLPDGKEPCAQMAVKALGEALNNQGEQRN